MRLLILLPIAFLLNACQTVQDQSIPLDSNFARQAVLLAGLLNNLPLRIS